jgi:hypothetical protein
LLGSDTGYGLDDYIGLVHPSNAARDAIQSQPKRPSAGEAERWIRRLPPRA